MALIRIANLAEVPPGTVREVRAADHTFAVCNVAGEIRVFNGVCPCAGGPVGRGYIFDGVLVCPWHGMRYDVDGGQCTLSTELRLERYASVVEDGEILAEVETSGALPADATLV